MTDQSIEDAGRREFEAHFTPLGYDLTITPGSTTYRDRYTHYLWLGFQAARQSSQSEPVAEVRKVIEGLKELEYGASEYDRGGDAYSLCPDCSAKYQEPHHKDCSIKCAIEILSKHPHL
jgi:hypothetical protein